MEETLASTTDSPDDHRHRLEDLLYGLRQLDPDLADDIEGLPKIPHRVAEALLAVREYYDRWRYSDYSHSEIGDDIGDSLDTIADFRDEHVRRMVELSQRHCRIVAEERARRQAREAARRCRSIGRLARARASGRRVMRVASSATKSTADPDPERSSDARTRLRSVALIEAGGAL